MGGPAASLITFVCLSSAALGGVLAHGRMSQLLGQRRRVTITRGAILVALAATALFLAGVATSLRLNFDTAQRHLGAFSRHVATIDATLRHTGPEGIVAREILFRYASLVLHDLSSGAAPASPVEIDSATELRRKLQDGIDHLGAAGPMQHVAADDAHRQVRELIDTANSLAQIAQPGLSVWVEVLAAIWLMLALAALGLTVDRTPVATLALVGIAATLAGVFFLVEEYRSPFSGIITVSAAPLEATLFSITD